MEKPTSKYYLITYSISYSDGTVCFFRTLWYGTIGEWFLLNCVADNSDKNIVNASEIHESEYIKLRDLI